MYNCHRVTKDCFIEVVGRWLPHEDGTGDNPYTWETIFNEKKLLTLLKKMRGLVVNLYWATCVGEMNSPYSTSSVSF